MTSADCSSPWRVLGTKSKEDDGHGRCFGSSLHTGHTREHPSSRCRRHATVQRMTREVRDWSVRRDDR
eukprot:1341416-Prymnesium_polylepis.1